MVFDLFGNILDWAGIFLHLIFSKLKYTAIRAFILLGVLVTILWLSVFLYASFYWLYMPSASHVRPVHFRFDVCSDGVGICTFPQANVTFGEDGREEILHKGQAYRIYLELELPESPTNRGIGMFMIKLQMYDRTGKTVQESARSAILHYRSLLLRCLHTVVFAPFYLAGLDEQKQVVDVEMFPHYVEGIVDSAVGAVVQINSKKIDIYSSRLKIFADFTGLRYYLFYWPKVSAICGIIANFSFLSFIVLLSWYQYLRKDKNTEEEEAFVPMMRRMSLDVRRQRIREQLERERALAADSSCPEDEDDTQVKTVGTSHIGSHDLQEESLGELAANDDDIVLMSSDVTLLPGSDNDDARLRLRRPSNVHADL